MLPHSDSLITTKLVFQVPKNHLVFILKSDYYFEILTKSIAENMQIGMLTQIIATVRHDKNAPSKKSEK